MKAKNLNAKSIAEIREKRANKSLSGISRQKMKIYTRQELKEEQETYRLAAVAELKKRLDTYGFEWKSIYENLSAADCKVLFKELMKANNTANAVQLGKEIRTCSGNCSTCERTECVKYASNKK